MINKHYFAEDCDNDSGGYCDFLLIKDNPEIGFKSFKIKQKANVALNNQKLLAKFNLAPEPITDLCKIRYYNYSDLFTDWGFITEKANIIDYDNIKSTYLHKIQKLVEEIWKKTKLKFWDCHEHNVGYIKRGRKKIFVCIDTGKESFEPHSNAWGFQEPGPKCPYCLRYQCKCSEY
jgi:hypothetical protein